jgi:hypothetical protein
MEYIAKPSIQSLFIEMKFNGQSLSMGTAFVVLSPKGPYLVTNRHNVTGRHQQSNAPLSPTGGIPNEIGIVHNRKGALGQWISKNEPLYIDDTPRWREHPTLGSEADFVALPLSDLVDVDIYPHDPGNSDPTIRVGVADVVSVIGFPFGMAAGGAMAVWASGFLASEPAVDFNDLPIQLIDCRSRQGQSGSPVIAYRGSGMVEDTLGRVSFVNSPLSKFIGVYSGRINPESDIGIVWKASALQQLILSL